MKVQMVESLGAKDGYMWALIDTLTIRSDSPERGGASQAGETADYYDSELWDRLQEDSVIKGNKEKGGLNLFFEASSDGKP